jgi:hypothetical protein
LGSAKRTTYGMRTTRAGGNNHEKKSAVPTAEFEAIMSRRIPKPQSFFKHLKNTEPDVSHGTALARDMTHSPQHLLVCTH